MGGIYRPSGDSFIGSHWSAVHPQATLYDCINKPFRPGGAEPDRFITHDAAGGVGFDDHRAIFNFPIPLSTDADIQITRWTVGDGGVTVKLCHRALFTGADFDVQFTARRGGVNGDFGLFTFASGAFLPGQNPSPWRVASGTAAVDPLTGSAWTSANLVLTSFGFWLPNGGSGNQMQVSGLQIDVDERAAAGGQKAPLGPIAHEPAYFCAICSEPHHLSKLIRPRDTLHPMYDRLVCKDCYDGITQLEDPIDGITEGDLDFES